MSCAMFIKLFIEPSDLHSSGFMNNFHSNSMICDKFCLEIFFNKNETKINKKFLSIFHVQHFFPSASLCLNMNPRLKKLVR